MARAAIYPAIVLTRILTAILATVLPGAKAVLRGSVFLGGQGSWDREREKQDRDRKDFRISHRHARHQSPPNAASKVFKSLVICATVSHVGESS